MNLRVFYLTRRGISDGYGRIPHGDIPAIIISLEKWVSRCPTCFLLNTCQQEKGEAKRHRVSLLLLIFLSNLSGWVYFLPCTSSETVNFLRPLARRAANTRRPLAVCMRWRKPCLLFLFLLWGWNVLFIFIMLFYFYISWGDVVLSVFATL